MIAKSHKLCLRRYHEAKLASSAAVVLAHLDGVDEAASTSARAIHCQEPVNCRMPDKQVSGNCSMEEQTVLSAPKQREVATLSGCPAGAVCSAAAISAEYWTIVQLVCWVGRVRRFPGAMCRRAAV